MVKLTRIGRLALIATTLVALAATSGMQAQARGFRLRLGVGGAAAGTPSVPTRLPGRIAIVATPTASPGPVAATVAPDAATPAPPVLRPVRAAAQDTAKPAVPPAATPVRVAGPWCPPERVVGAGAGFCQVN